MPLRNAVRIYQAGYTCKDHNGLFLWLTHLEEKKKLLNRVRRIRGQVEAIDRALEQEAECSDVLHNISACRGAMDALMAEVIEGHIRFHILDPERHALRRTGAGGRRSDPCAARVSKIDR